VPWGRDAAAIIVVASEADGRPVIAEVEVAAGCVECHPGTNGR
jgi:hypothetical protein